VLKLIGRFARLIRFVLLDAYFNDLFFQAEDVIRDLIVTGVQTCALPISVWRGNRTSTTLRKASPCNSLKRWRPRIGLAATGTRKRARLPQRCGRFPRFTSRA